MANRRSATFSSMHIRMGNNVIIEVRDDGAGINVDEVRQKALDKGTITSEQAELMSDKEIVELLIPSKFFNL